MIIRAVTLWFFLSFFRKASTGDGPREGELEDLHEDEPSSWVLMTLLCTQHPLYIHCVLTPSFTPFPQSGHTVQTYHSAPETQKLEFFCFVFWGEVCHVTYTLASAPWSFSVLFTVFLVSASWCEEHRHVCGSSPVYFTGLKLYYRQRQTSLSQYAWRIFRPHHQPVCRHLTGGNRLRHVKDTVLSKWTTRLLFHQSL